MIAIQLMIVINIVKYNFTLLKGYNQSHLQILTYMQPHYSNIIQKNISPTPIDTGQMAQTGRLIKFPTITKLSYDGDNSNPQKNMFKNTLTKLNAKNQYPLIHNAAVTQGGSFRVVEVQPDDYVIKISMMSINQPANKLKGLQKEGYASEEQIKTTRKVKTRPVIFKQRSASLLTNINYESLIKRQSQPNAVAKASTADKTDHTQTNNSVQDSQVKLRSRTKSLIKLKIGQNIPTPVPQSKINMNQLYSQVVNAIALINGGVICNQVKSFQRIRRAKIDKGNNGYLVRQTIKKRSWWNITQDSSEANLIWTEKTIKNIQPQQNRCFYVKIQNEQDKKVVFQRNIDQTLSYYPRMLQLFFTEQQINKILNLDSKFKKSYTIYNFLTSKKAQYKLIAQNIIFYNHIPNNFEITSKKMLHKNLLWYYSQQQKNPYQYIPNTYHLTAFDWQQKIHFIKTQQKKLTSKSKSTPQKSKAWFLKPGQNTNRGHGIHMFKSTTQAVDYVMRNPPKSINKTYILQQYINPLLYDGRKFDIRCYLLCIQVLDTQTYYWYEQGYIRTSSSKFSMNKTSVSIHLTNDAVQKQFDNYDKYESANKLSYIEIDKYIKNEYGYNFLGEIVPRMKSIATDVCKAAHNMGKDQKMRKNESDNSANDDQENIHARESSNIVEQTNQNNNIPQKQSSQQKVKQKYPGLYFQIFGLDFIISKDGTPYLLQVNTNPCLQINNNLLSRIIPDVVQNTFRLVTDVYLPNKSTIINANNTYNNLCPDWAQNFILNNKFSLIYRNRLKFNDYYGIQQSEIVKKDQDKYENENQSISKNSNENNGNVKQCVSKGEISQIEQNYNSTNSNFKNKYNEQPIIEEKFHNKIIQSVQYNQTEEKEQNKSQIQKYQQIISTIQPNIEKEKEII